MLNVAFMRLDLACCLKLMVVITSVLPCPCLWAANEGHAVTRVASTEPDPGGRGQHDCTCCARRMAQLPTRRLSSEAFSSDALAAPFVLLPEQFGTRAVPSLSPQDPDVAPSPDIYEIQVLRE